MSAPVINPSGDQTAHRLLTTDVNLTSPLNTAAPIWTTIQYVEDNDFNPDDAVMAESGVYGDGGWGNQDKLGATWHATLTVNHMSVPGNNPPIYDPTHNFLEALSVAQFGAANRGQFRFYDWDVNDATGLVTPRGQAYMGFASVSWPGYGSGATTDKRQVAVSLQGKGPLYKISHPYPLAGAVPNITAKQNSAGGPATGLLDAGGEIIRVFGDHFTGVTGVTIGGTACKYDIVNDSRIDVVTPAHASGTAALVVTNGTGASTTGGTVSYV
jgi:hypothetical protein